MLPSTTAPMLGAVRSGGGRRGPAWVRQDFQAGYHRRSRAERRWKPAVRRGLRRAENARITAEQLAEAETSARDTITVALMDQEAEFDAWLYVGEQVEMAEAETWETWDDEACTALVPTADETAIWGQHFDPYEVQWGFTVREGVGVDFGVQFPHTHRPRPSTEDLDADHRFTSPEEAR